MRSILKIGIVGLNAESGWACYAHLPALARVEGVRVTAVATTRMESAREAAARFAIPHAFDNPVALASSPDVDLVLVSVKAPSHSEPVMAAIAAGKAAFVEWPMGASLAEAQAMTDAGRRAGVPTFVGIQARAAPPVVHAKALTEQGYVGRVISAAMQGSYSFWGNPVATAYSTDVRNGATILTIPGGHGLDMLTFLLGEVASLSARETHLRDQTMAADVGRMVAMTSPDQFACVGDLKSGALFSAHFVGAALRGEQFRLHIVGDAGELLLEGDGMPEIAKLRLFGTQDKASPLRPIDVPLLAAGLIEPPAPGPSFNVACLWAAIASHTTGSSPPPNFEAGLRSRILIDTIARSAALGGAPLQVG